MDLTDEHWSLLKRHMPELLGQALAKQHVSAGVAAQK
jgi:hypothetical protein